MTEDNERLVRAFYEATVPGHRESLSGLQSVHVMYKVPEEIFTGGDGIEDFFHEFCAAFGICFVAEEFITMDERVVAIGHIKGETVGSTAPIDVPFVHVWTIRDDRLEQLLFFTDTAMLTQVLAQQAGWNARSEAKGDEHGYRRRGARCLEQIAFVPVVPAPPLSSPASRGRMKEGV